ncbi:MAG: iron transporter FeoA [Gammaproteobacteria bacterium]|nr:iron transporter FeoA [Gammaproteobacteria bacterium]
MLDLRDLKIGEQAIIKGFEAGRSPYRQKLLAMGLTKGTAFTLVRKAPLGCPIAIQIRSSILILRQNEANCLILDRINLCAN